MACRQLLKGIMNLRSCRKSWYRNERQEECLVDLALTSWRCLSVFISVRFFLRIRNLSIFLHLSLEAQNSVYQITFACIGFPFLPPRWLFASLCSSITSFDYHLWHRIRPIDAELDRTVYYRQVRLGSCLNLLHRSRLPALASGAAFPNFHSLFCN